MILITSIAISCKSIDRKDNVKLLFSHSAGYYKENFDLIISHQKNEESDIYYTIDGSTPNINSKRFENSISTKNKSTANISAIATTLSPGKKRKWLKSKYKKNNSLVIKAQLFSDQTPISEVFTSTYFIIPDSITQHQLPRVSISCNKDLLFDKNLGILVPGNNKTANYDQRGKDWERPIHLEWFDKNGKVVLNQKAGIRIHGGTSRQFPLKGLRFYARSEYGKPTFDHQLFKNRPFNSYQRFILRPSGHDFYLTFFRDALIQSFAKDLKLDYSEVQPVLLYINGEYWGITNARERFDKYYIEQHYGIENAYICDDSDLNFKKTVQFISELNPKEDIDYNKIKEQIDIQNFTDFKIFESFFYRWDLGNIKPWRNSETKGRWKFILSDFDVGMGGFWSIDDPHKFDFIDYLLDPNGPWEHLQGHNHNNYNNTIILRKLLENDEYKQYFVLRYLHFIDKIVTTENILTSIDKFASKIEGEIPNHILRWGYPNSTKEWKMNVDHLKSFAKKRPSIVRKQLLERFGKISLPE